MARVSMVLLLIAGLAVNAVAAMDIWRPCQVTTMLIEPGDSFEVESFGAHSLSAGGWSAPEPTWDRVSRKSSAITNKRVEA